MYTIKEYDVFPFQMSIEHNGIEIVPVSRHAYGTRDNLASVSKRPENIAQYASLVSMIERANRAEAAEARAAALEQERDEARRQLAEAQARIAELLQEARDSASRVLTLMSELAKAQVQIAELEANQAKPFYHPSFDEGDGVYRP